MEARIEVFSGPNCIYCERAKRLLNEYGLEFRELSVSEEKNLDEVTRRVPTARTIPQIFIDGEHVGGFDDLKKMADAGGLDGMKASGG